MSGETVKLIEISIALIFVYLTLSIFVTSLVQILISFLRLRSVNLAQGLSMLLNDIDAVIKAEPAVATTTPQGGLGQMMMKVFDGVVWLSNMLRTVLAMAIMGRSLQGRIGQIIVGKEGAALSGTLAGDVLKHPLINSLASGEQVASHIDPKSFAAALMAVLQEKAKALDPQSDPATIEDVVKIFEQHGYATSITRVMKAIVLPVERVAQSAEDKYAVGKETIARWYDDAMVNIADWYKERSRLLTLVVALIITVGANIDTFRIIETLWTNSELRNTLVSQAMNTEGLKDRFLEKCPETTANVGAGNVGAGNVGVGNAPPSPDKLRKDTECRLGVIRDVTMSLNQLPMGWWDDTASSSTAATAGSPAPGSKNLISATPTRGTNVVWYHRVVGWLLTAFALSLGAPFWFDLLSQIINLRNGPRAGTMASTPVQGQAS